MRSSHTSRLTGVETRRCHPFAVHPAPTKSRGSPESTPAGGPGPGGAPGRCSAGRRQCRSWGCPAGWWPRPRPPPAGTPAPPRSSPHPAAPAAGARASAHTSSSRPLVAQPCPHSARHARRQHRGTPGGRLVHATPHSAPRWLCTGPPPRPPSSARRLAQQGDPNPLQTLTLCPERTRASCTTRSASAADWPCGRKPPSTEMLCGSRPQWPITAMPAATTALAAASRAPPPPAGALPRLSPYTGMTRVVLFPCGLRSRATCKGRRH